MFPEFTFRGEGSDQKQQQFTFILDIELWVQSLMSRVIVIPKEGWACFANFSGLVSKEAFLKKRKKNAKRRMGAAIWARIAAPILLLI